MNRTLASSVATLLCAASLPSQQAGEHASHNSVGPRLAAALTEQVDGPLPVVFWLRSDFRPRTVLDDGVARGMHPEDARRAALAAAAEEYGPLTEGFAASLKAQGIEVSREDPCAPLVFATVPTTSIAEFAARSAVWRVFLADGQAVAEGPGSEMPRTGRARFNQFASRTARTDYVHRQGIDGTGVKVLINDTMAMVSSHTYLPTIISGSAAPSVARHPTALAGIVASSHPVHTGAAPGVTLYDHDQAGDFGSPIAWAWAMQRGVSFGVCSWGTSASNGSIAFLDIYFDYVIRQFGVLMFKSAGNGGPGNDLTTPGLGYNMVSVGGAHDLNTLTWDDDAMSFRSSTANPGPTFHEKPEVIAPCESIFSTRPNNLIGLGGSGTSYAAPLGAGVAALLGQTDPLLLAKPEAVRALLMAGAHNVDGADPLSDNDGAGMINAATAQDAAAQQQFVATTLTAGSFTTGGIWSHSFHLDAGDATRVAAVWLSESDQVSVDVVRMDLDMVVRDPMGQVVASSASSVNPFELVAFVPQLSGMYVAEMQQTRFQGTSEPFALAWITKWNGRTNEVTLSGPATRGQTLGITFSDPYHPTLPYAAVVAITPYPATWVLPGDAVLRLGYDFFADASLSLPGFIGILNSQGQATTSVPIPNFPGLVGTTFYLGMVTLQPGFTAVKDTSSVVPLTIQ